MAEVDKPYGKILRLVFCLCSTHVWGGRDFLYRLLHHGQESLLVIHALTFESRKFVLKEVPPKIRMKLINDAHWKQLPEDSFSTTSLQAAVKFRKFADAKVEKIFKRTFQEIYDLPIENYGFAHDKLDPHQQTGIRWILTRKRSYLAHAPGAGKTVQVILAGLWSGSSRLLFIVPPFLTVNWEREIEFFSPWLGEYGDITVIPRSDKKETVDWGAKFIICPDSMLSREWVQEGIQKIGFDFIAVDEASRFKEAFSERSLAFYGGRRTEKGKKEIFYPGIFQNARHVTFMDGSPMPNRPMELWAPTYALSPSTIDCMGQDDFGYRYCGAKPNARGIWEYKFSSNEHELKEKLQSNFMHVVTEYQLNHTKRKRSILFMDRDPRTNSMVSWERKHLKGLTSLTEKNSQGDLARYRQQLGASKVPWIAEYTKYRLEEKNESILLFVWHREVAEKLYQYFAQIHQAIGLVIGGTPASEREILFKQFQAGKTKLLILNIGAGGRGHNLQRADRIIFGEWSWSDETNKQCEHRAARRGNEKSHVLSEYLCVPNSIDEITLRSNFTKEERVKKVIG